MYIIHILYVYYMYKCVYYIVKWISAIERTRIFTISLFLNIIKCV